MRAFNLGQYVGTYSVPSGSMALCRSNFSLLMVDCLSFGASCEALMQGPDGKTQTRLFFFLKQKFPTCKNKSKSGDCCFLGGCSIAFMVHPVVPVLAAMGHGYLLMHPSPHFSVGEEASREVSGRFPVECQSKADSDRGK